MQAYLNDLVEQLSMTYGDRLKKAMDAANCDRKTLAKALGISVQAVALVINGQTKKFDAVNHGKAHRFLRVDDEWLATGIGTMPPKAGEAQASPLSATAQYLGRWLDKIQDQETKERVAHSAMLEILRVIDGPDLHTTPEPSVQSKTPRVERPARSK